MVPLDEEQLEVLRLYGQDTYCINLGPSKARNSLVDLDLLEWVPAPVWSGHHTYALTEEGRIYREWLNGTSKD